MPAYYNEIDPKAAAWLRELIKRGYGNAIVAQAARTFIESVM